MHSDSKQKCIIFDILIYILSSKIKQFIKIILSLGHTYYHYKGLSNHFVDFLIYFNL